MADIFNPSGGFRNSQGGGDLHHDNGQCSSGTDGSGSSVSRAEEEQRKALEREARKEEQQKAAVSGYTAFKNSLVPFEKNKGKEFKLKREVEELEESRARYVTLWNECIMRARNTWSMAQGRRNSNAEAKREQLRESARKEKEVRKQEVDSKESYLAASIKNAERRQAKIRNEQQQCQEELANADSYVAVTFSCDEEAENFLKGAKEKGYLSTSQDKLCQMSPEEFCTIWAPNASALKTMEQQLLSTAFLQEAMNYHVTGDGFKSRKNTTQVFFTLFGFLGCYLVKLLPGVFGWLGLLIYIAAVSSVFYYIITVIASLITYLYKNRKKMPSDSFLGTLALLVAVFISLQGSYDAVSFASNTFVDCLEWAISFGFFPRIIMNQFYIKKGMMTSQKSLKKEYKKIFLGAEDYEKKNDQDTAFQPGQIDAMIACYLRHDELLQYLNMGHRGQHVEELKARYQSLETEWNKMEQEKQNARNEYAQIGALRRGAARKDQETDARLANDLARVDRDYGALDRPDFEVRGSLSPEDRNALEKMEIKLGLHAAETGSKTAALLAFDRNCAGKRVEQQRVQEELAEELRVIQEWFKSEYLPPFVTGRRDENGRNEYLYSMEEYILLCLESEQENHAARPRLIRHGGRPLLIECPGIKAESMRVHGVVQEDLQRTDAAYVNRVVRELWKAFTKMVPSEIMRITIVDPAGKLVKRLKETRDDTVRLDFNRHVKDGLQPGGDGSISSLFTESEIEKFDESLLQMVREVQDYINDNAKDMAQAPQELRSFARMNYCRTSTGSPNPMLYNVVFVVVPDELSETRAPGWLLRNLSGMLEDNDGFDSGVLPIVITTKDSVSEKWTGLVRDATNNGVRLKL